ncbi:MAG: hypothetical protein Q8M29_15290 [Bacteroidota bacterium]|nr:hypothetical protein [Bacteroidota bacterium]
MINATEILRNLKSQKLNGIKKILFESESIRIVHQAANLEVECLGERDASRRDLGSLAIFFRKYYLLTRNHKILVLLSRTWRLDSGAWDLITKLGFFGKFAVAFVSTELHQGLLLKNLEKLEFNLKTFKNREKAEEWLSIQN